MNFKDIEKDIFEYVCNLAVEITLNVLEDLDKELQEKRDKSRYRSKDKHKTTIKTVYGNVEYSRRYYYDYKEGKCCFLLDDFLETKKGKGLLSANVKELIASACIDMSYQDAADFISETTGLSVSKTGTWNTVQELGCQAEQYQKQKISEQEECTGKDVKVLFEETDGVWLKCQNPDKSKGKSFETKLVTIYEGWSELEPNKLVNKTVIGGISRARELKKKTEAIINSIYNIDEIELRVINGDGAGWIDQMSDGNIVYQLDRFHVLKYINTFIKEKKVQNQIRKALKEKKVDKMIDIIETYMNSIDGIDLKAYSDAAKIYSYFTNNKDYILRYNERDDIVVPAPDDGIIYKNMGVQENQNCSLISMRMKHRRMRWSKSGSNNLIRLICAKENNELKKIIDFVDFRIVDAEGRIKKALSAADIPVRIGTDEFFEKYKVSIPLLDTSSPTSKAIRGLI